MQYVAIRWSLILRRKRDLPQSRAVHADFVDAESFRPGMLVVEDDPPAVEGQVIAVDNARRSTPAQPAQPCRRCSDNVNSPPPNLRVPVMNSS